MKALKKLQEQAVVFYDAFHFDPSDERAIRLVPSEKPLFDVKYLDEISNFKWKKNYFKAECLTPLMGAEQSFEPGVVDIFSRSYNKVKVESVISAYDDLDKFKVVVDDGDDAVKTNINYDNLFDENDEFTI